MAKQMEVLKEGVRNGSITMAEVYVAEVMEKEMQAAGIEKDTYVWQLMSRRAVEAITGHREELRDIYKRSKAAAAQWIIDRTGIREHQGFMKMKKLGMTGDVMHDLEIIKKMSGGGADR